MIYLKLISTPSNTMFNAFVGIVSGVLMCSSCNNKDQISKYPADFAYIEEVNSSVEKGIYKTQNCTNDCDSSHYHTGKLISVVLNENNEIVKAHLQNHDDVQQLNEDYFFKGDTLVAAEISFTNISKNSTLKNWHIAYLFADNLFYEYDFSSKQKKQMDTSALYLNEFRELRNYIFRTFNSHSFGHPSPWDNFQKETTLLSQLHKDELKVDKTNTLEYHYADQTIYNITHESQEYHAIRDVWFSNDSTLLKYSYVGTDGQDDFVIEKGRIVNFKYLDRSRTKYKNKPEHQIVAELNATALKDKELIKTTLKEKE